jgi:hypothetical protein
VSVTVTGLDRLKRSIAAVAATAGAVWYGRVVTGPRPPTTWDPAPLHGRTIAALLKARGHDPMVIAPAHLGHARRRFRTAAFAALQRAHRDLRPHPLMIKEAVRIATQYLADALIDRIASGRLGVNSPATVQIKLRLIAIGRATTAYGRPPPYGIQTGRFIRNLKVRVTSGSQGGSPISSEGIRGVTPGGRTVL